MSRRAHDLEIIRGDSYELWVGLAQGWTFVDPAAHEGRLVLRDAQSDYAPETLALVSELLPGEDERFPDLTHLLHFTATPDDTQALPDWRMACFCEVRSKDLTYVKRLFDAAVEIRD